MAVEAERYTSQTRPAGRWSTVAPLLGLLFVVLVIGSVTFGNTPATSKSPAVVLAFYKAHRSREYVSAFIGAPAVVVGLFWFAYLRQWLQRRDVNERWGAVAFAGGILFAVLGGIAVGLELALVDTPKYLTPDTAAALNFLESDVPLILASMALGVIAIAAGIAALKTQYLPTWVGWVSLVVGVIAVAPVGDFISLPAIGVWVLFICAVMWFRDDPDGTLAP
jgi:hypothetical protein